MDYFSHYNGTPADRLDDGRVMRSTPETDQSGERTGSVVRVISAVRAGPGTNEQLGQVEEPGYGLEILAGADAWESTASISVTMLAGDGDSPGVRSERSFTGREVYNGAVLVGRFDRVHVSWIKSRAASPNPLVVRIWTFPIRAVPTGAPRPHGRAVLDWFDGELFGALLSTADRVIYDDGAPVAPTYLGDGGTGTPAPGTGLGGDYRQGLHRSAKRGVLLHSRCTQAYTLDVLARDQADAWSHLMTVPSVARTAGDGTAYEACTLSPRAASNDSVIGTSPSPVYLPHAIRIVARADAVGNPTLTVWLSFTD
jgi:hypothetical protein